MIYKDTVDIMKKDNPFITNGEIAYQVVREDILTGKIKPGQQVTQEDIALLIGMSRSPIREAFIRLEKEGYLVRSGRGYRVYTIEPKDFLSLMEFRMCLEGFGAKLAAQRILDDDISKLSQVLDHYKMALKKQDYNQIIECDSLFHSKIILASNNDYLIKAYRNYDTKIKFYMTLVVRLEHSNSIISRHERILSAIAKRDERRAEIEATGHLKVSIDKGIGLVTVEDLA